jgi:hypothetical protein
VKPEVKHEVKPEAVKEEEEDDAEVPAMDAAAMRRLEANMKPEAPICDCFKDKGGFKCYSECEKS